MRTRLLVLLTSVGVCVGTALVGVAPAAQADSPPWGYDPWPDCSPSIVRYCVETKQLNGIDVAPGDTFQPYIDTLLPDTGTVRYGVTREPGGTGDVDPGDVYKLVVRTGSIHPRELYGNIRNVTFAVSGSDATGWKFTMTFQPTPVHWVGYTDPAPHRSCTVAACGDDTWAADLNYIGFVTGYVTNLASSGLSTAEIGWRTGMIRAYNAQDENTYYDPDTDSFVIQLANPHLVGGAGPDAGTPATGSYQAFLPNAYLTNVMNVPDPSTVTTGSFTISRTVGGSTTYVPFTVTHLPGGVQISIPSITYSRPTYRIRPRPTVPGRPRAVVARKVTAHTARVRFVRPAANGGRRIDLYQARCHRVGKAWHYARRTVSPITVTNLPRGPVLCQVRAHNAKGYGRWSALDRT